MRSLYALLLLCFTYSLTINAQTVYVDEDFNDCAFPNNWSYNLIGNQDAVWYVGQPDNQNSDGSSIDGSCMLIWDDDATGNNTADWSMEVFTPVFDGTANSTITLEVDVHFREYAESFLKIKVFDGTEFVEIAAWQGFNTGGVQFSDFVHFTADLSFYANPDMQVMFEWNDGYDWTWWAGIDNVSIIGTGDETNLITEDFNGCGIPAGWTTNIQQGENDWQFGYVENGNTGSNSMNGTCFAYFDDDGLGQDAPFSTALLISPPFDGTQVAELNLDFDVILRRYTDLEHLGVYIWDGTTATNVVNYFTDLGGPDFTEYIHERIDISLFRSATMQIVFAYDDGDDWGWWVGIDNVKISGSGISNDLCSNAIDLELNADCIEGNNLTALFEGDDPSCSIRNEGALWYRYQSVGNNLLEVITNADYNDVITIYTGDCGNLTEVLCYDGDEQGFDGENLFSQTQNGQTYYLRISGKRSDFGVSRGELCMQLKSANNFPPVQDNDACGNAFVLELNGNCVESNNINANMDGDLPSLNVLSRADIWYQYTPQTNGEIEIQADGDFADVITLFSGSCGNLTEVAGNDYGQKLRTNNLNIGETYLIQISGFFSTIEGTICAQIVEVEETPPTNDDCVNATPITVGGACISSTNAGATASDLRPSCETNYDASVWYTFEVPTSGKVQINTGADFVHTIALYEGTCNNLEEIHCASNPLRCDGYFEVGNLAPNETYYLQLVSSESHLGLIETGNFCLEILDGDEMTMPALDLSVNVECTAAGIGTLIVQAIGGEGNYTFLGNTNGETLNTGDDYLVIVMDENGCEKSESGTVNCGIQNCLITATVVSQNASCNASNNGTASIVVENETGEVNIEWSTGATTSDIANLEPGGYSVTVTDANGCPVSSAFTITEPMMLESNASSENESAFEANDGEVSASPTGGTSPYQYAWSNGSTSQSQTGLSPGEYTVTITDVNECTSQQVVVVEAFSCVLNASIFSENISCNGAADGTASIEIIDGATPYTYVWSNGQTTSTATDLAPGTYSVIASDANDCPVEMSVSITQPNALQANAEATSETAAGNNDGTATASPNGGTMPYEYLWSNGETTQSINNLPPTNYTVLITDANDCTTEESVTVQAADCALSIQIETEDATCNGAENGTALVIFNGGTAPFEVAWESGNNGPIEENLAAGYYEATVTDAGDCAFVAGFIIEEPLFLNYNFTAIENVACAGDFTGTATVQAEGGTMPYTYLWSDGTTTATLQNAPTGEQEVLIIDANNCEISATVYIGIEDNINPTVSTQNLTIELDENGLGTITEAQIDNGSIDNCAIEHVFLDINDFSCTNIGENTVILTVIDVNGNQGTGTAIITVEDNLAPEIDCPANIIADCDNYIEYAFPTATDNCSPGQPVQIEGIGSGNEFPAGETTETYIVTDFAGNTATCSFTITVQNPLTANLEVNKPLCAGDANGSATIDVAGGGNLSYQWDDNSMQTTATANNLAAGTYHVTVTDEAGCELIETVVIPDATAIELTIESVVDDLNNTGNGAVAIAVIGGEPPYNFNWILDGATVSLEEDPNGLFAGDYTLEITDANGCVLTSETITIDMNVSADEQLLMQYFELFPNPTASKFYLQINLPQVEDIDIQIYDVAGRLMRQAQPQRMREGLLNFDSSTWSGGVYEVRAVVGNEVLVWKVVKL